MCYNTPISFVFSVVGITTALYIMFSPSDQQKVSWLKHSGIQYILLFYSFMELLQGIQYYVVNQCSNPINILLTNVAYILVIAQPLIWNGFFYINSVINERNIFVVAMWLSSGWIAVNLLSRILYGYTTENQTKYNSVYAANKVCTKRKLSHLYWEWTSANFGEMNANMLMYLMVWFVPALVSSSFRIISLILVFSAMIGAFASWYLGEFFTFTSLWCYISVPIVLAVIGYMLNIREA